MRTVITLALLLVLGCAPPSAALANLIIAPETGMADYSRDRFPHWIGQGGGCDTREVVIRRQGTDVATGRDCKAVSGSWVSLYDGVVVTDAGELDVDHLVPLAEAWRSGADQWTEEQRRDFANDLGPGRLVAVTARSNGTKGDQDPAKWKPARKHWCTYAVDWVAVKAAYRLTVDRAEYDALTSMMADCPAG